MKCKDLGQSFKFSFFSKSSRGQVIVEYVLLLVIAVSIAALIVRELASRGDDPGILVKKWYDIQVEIGKDIPDKCEGTDCR